MIGLANIFQHNHLGLRLSLPLLVRHRFAALSTKTNITMPTMTAPMPMPTFPPSDRLSSELAEEPPDELDGPCVAVDVGGDGVYVGVAYEPKHSL